MPGRKPVSRLALVAALAVPATAATAQPQPLQPDTDRPALANAAPGLPEWVRDDDDLLALHRASTTFNLSARLPLPVPRGPDPASLVFAAFLARVAEVEYRPPYDFSPALAALTPEQSRAIFDTMATQTGALIQAAGEPGIPEAAFERLRQQCRDLGVEFGPAPIEQVKEARGLIRGLPTVGRVFAVRLGFNLVVLGVNDLRIDGRPAMYAAPTWKGGGSVIFLDLDQIRLEGTQLPGLDRELRPGGHPRNAYARRLLLAHACALGLVWWESLGDDTRREYADRFWPGETAPAQSQPAGPIGAEVALDFAESFAAVCLYPASFRDHRVSRPTRLPTDALFLHEPDPRAEGLAFVDALLHPLDEVFSERVRQAAERLGPNP